MQTTKQPRDFVHTDEFWDADECWPHYFISGKIWVFVDEYRAGLIGDEDYSRIIIHAGNNEGWKYHRPLSEKINVLKKLREIQLPVSEQQLETLGFIRWQDDYI